MIFKMFWIFPLLGMLVFLLLAYFIFKHLFGGPLGSPPLERKPPQRRGKVPEELKKAGREILDNLDWDIRLLEKRRLDEDDPVEYEKIELELKRKKEEYQTVVERLDQ